jgi:hypothetical protein
MLRKRSATAIHLHGSVRLFHAQLLTKPAPTFRVSDETNEFCTTPLSKGNGKVLKRDWSIITAFNEHEGCSHAQTIVLNGHNRNRDCCCSVSCLVACRYATSSDHCIIVDQPHRHDGDLQGSATNRAVGRHLKVLFQSFSSSFLPSDLAPVPCRGFLY